MRAHCHACRAPSSPSLHIFSARFRPSSPAPPCCFWHSADEQKGPGDSQRTRARLRSLPSSCIRRGAACPYQIFACASAPRSTPPVPMAQHWPRSPLGPMPEISFARPPSPTAGHSNPIVSLRRQRASPVEARTGGVSKGRQRAPCPPWPRCSSACSGFVEDNGFPWPPPGLLGIFLELLLTIFS